MVNTIAPDFGRRRSVWRSVRKRIVDGKTTGDSWDVAGWPWVNVSSGPLVAAGPRCQLTQMTSNMQY